MKKQKLKISAGSPAPLGATLKKGGVNFALFSGHAKKVFLLLYDEPDGAPTAAIELKNRARSVWHVFIEGLEEGQLYAYRVRGEYNPGNGMRFNDKKLLIDPCAKAFTGKHRNEDNLLLAYNAGSPDRDLSLDERDDSRVVPRSIVVDDSFDWEGDRPPRVPKEDLIIYEAHLKGFTAHSSSRVRHPGTYLGFAEKISYLKELGINAVELLPVYEFYVRDQLETGGLTEYWGYNTVGFFAPESSYSTMQYLGCAVREFKTLVKKLHRAGMEIILDVVYNHTAEGSELGPTLSFRGIDNRAYYALEGPPNEPYRKCVNDSRCGNTLNCENPHALNFVLDSLRYWVREMHVDGFRFDLATLMARCGGKYSRAARFFRDIARDPLLSRVKLIAEPWDSTSYQVGNFPAGWAEWNDKFRDTVRRFVKGDQGQTGELAARLSGSPDIYSSPARSVNFISCHDGFTLNDIFSYNGKHNEANRENNMDGSDYNSSWNCGVEGDTLDPEIIKLRKRLAKNALCCLFFSAGVPMLCGGDEFLRTQKGNNNAYCQDNELSWFDWDLMEKNRDVYEFCKKALELRKQHGISGRTGIFPGRKHCIDAPELKLLFCRIDGAKYRLMLILNSDINGHRVKLPHNKGMQWRVAVDTGHPAGEEIMLPGEEKRLNDQEAFPISPRSVAILVLKKN